MMLKSMVVAMALAVSAVSAQAADTACPQHFLDGAPPKFVNEKLAAKTRELCNAGYAVLHSGVTRTGLWSAEHLTRERLDQQRGLERKNTFHAEPRLSADERAELADYARSGYDRGHMAPSGDMADPVSQNESFSLANMVPQNSNNNRNLWEGIESAVRDLTRKEGEVYVVTGSIFQGQNLQRVGGRVLVPTHLFKAIYDARQRKAAAFLVTNAEGNAYQRIAIADLVAVSGIDPFPNLSASVKTTAMELPQPRPHGKGSKKAAETEPFQEKSVLDFLKQFLR
ncbi:DNA/RNA non-specific endonuclease [Azospirillum cavernae]|uniref:Endonuclease n=1 Tax=Azospirillum cavernae TaxID=2320860 RepID=A0A418W5E7_9PROT|nr:DNA/RNA non-specific endonuclease [Azospirillum cavernae]RJF85256.1 DNA/RNA non-specific endonuclease [Azospirillum cavernae]